MERVCLQRLPAQQLVNGRSSQEIEQWRHWSKLDIKVPAQEMLQRIMHIGMQKAPKVTR